jgi:predicted RNase H-like nuclease (RuvC/YqgF family)
MTQNSQAVETLIIGRYSQLDLEERNEYLNEELKACRKKIEELEAEVVRLTDEIRIAEKNGLQANREARELRSQLASSQSKVRELVGSE